MRLQGQRRAGRAYQQVLDDAWGQGRTRRARKIKQAFPSLYPHQEH
jgi:hypothetical protein